MRLENPRVSFRQHRLRMAPIYGVCNVIQISTDGPGPSAAPLDPLRCVCSHNKMLPGCPGRRAISPGFPFPVSLDGVFQSGFLATAPTAVSTWSMRSAPSSEASSNVSFGPRFSRLQRSERREVLLGNRHHQPAQDKWKTIWCEVDRYQAH